MKSSDEIEINDHALSQGPEGGGALVWHDCMSSPVAFGLKRNTNSHHLHRQLNQKASLGFAILYNAPK
jgi:hypothetical protein